MKKICFLIGNLNNSGGTERVTTLIANALAQQDYQVSILSLADGSQAFFDLEPSICINSIYPEKVSMKKNFLGAVWRIRKFVTANRVDTLIVVDSISCIFTVPALTGLKVKHICWEHFNFNVNLGIKLRDLGRKWAAKYCDYVVTLTTRDKELWENGLKNINAKIVAISNPSPYPIQNNQPSLNHKTILCVGRLTYQKGFDLLIKAWSKIVSQLPEWRIIIVGTGEDECMLKEMAKDYNVSNSIVFAGQQVDMDKFYRKTSFFCMSSRFEGLPMVLLEAQSYGLPIVAFDCDTGPAEVINDQSGFLVPTGDIVYLSEMIKTMANLKPSTYQNMTIHSRLNSKNFSVEKIIIEWQGLV